MLKCLTVICLLGLTVSAFEWENANANAGKKSQRMNLLSRTVGARMLAGTNDQGFQPMNPTTNQQFVPIQRQTGTGVQSIAGQVMDNSLNGGQQLTTEQIQQLQQFLAAQQQTQQVQPTQQPTQQTVQRQMTSPMQQTQQFQPTQQQTQQPQQMFRMDTNGVVAGMNPNGMNPTGVNPTTGQQNTMTSQGRMVNPSVATFATTTTPITPTVPQVSSMNTQASKPSALEQQLLDQQILTQKLKEQLQQLQQQQTATQTLPTQQKTVQTPTQQTGFVQKTQQQGVDQLTPDQKIQRMTQQQQQTQQQQLLDQINQLNQLNQQQGRMTGPTTTGTQNTFQSVPTPTFGTKPTIPTQPFMPMTNTSRMVNSQTMQPIVPVGQTGQFKQQQRIGGGDICANAKPGDLMPHPLDETQFIVCNELGEITLMDCPNHTVFNPHLKLCDLTSEMPLLCKTNPCLNGAKCVEVSPIEFRCECPQGFSGKTCEKFDTCQSSRPCGADGVCLSFALGSPIPHVCLCNGGRSVGLTCASGEQNPCTVPGSNTKLMQVNFNRAVFAHCEGARPHFKFCQPPLMFSASKQACEWSV